MAFLAKQICSAVGAAQATATPNGSGSPHSMQVTAQAPGGGETGTSSLQASEACVAVNSQMPLSCRSQTAFLAMQNCAAVGTAQSTATPGGKGSPQLVQVTSQACDGSVVGVVGVTMPGSRQTSEAGVAVNSHAPLLCRSQIALAAVQVCSAVGAIQATTTPGGSGSPQSEQVTAQALEVSEAGASPLPAGIRSPASVPLLRCASTTLLSTVTDSPEPLTVDGAATSPTSCFRSPAPHAENPSEKVKAKIDVNRVRIRSLLLSAGWSSFWVRFVLLVMIELVTGSQRLRHFMFTGYEPWLRMTRH